MIPKLSGHPINRVLFSLLEKISTKQMEESMMNVKDLMTTGISCVKEDASAIQIAKQMKQENVGIIPVCNDKGEILGVITDRDLVLRWLATEKGLNSDRKEVLKAGDIMSKNIVCTSPDMNTHHAALLMAKNQVRRLPVTQNGKLVGMLALADLARKPVFVDEAGDALSAISADAPPLYL